MWERENLVSIVIPAYNVEKQIKKCVQSIINSRDENCEILLITRKDDLNEQDKTISLCREYALKYTFIRHLFQDGIGLSNARNKGIEEARGVFLIFIDSDDFVNPKQFSKYISIIRERYFSYDCIVNDFYMKVSEQRIILRKQIFSDNVEKFLNQKSSCWNVWRYAYRLDFIKLNGLRFVENHMCEDVDFTSRIFMETDKIALLHMPYYCYDITRNDSLYNAKGIEYIADLLEISYKLLKSINDSKRRERLLRIKIWREMVLALSIYLDLNDLNKDLFFKIYLQYFNKIKKLNRRYDVLIRFLNMIGIRKIAIMLAILKKIRRKVIFR